VKGSGGGVGAGKRKKAALGHDGKGDPRGVLSHNELGTGPLEKKGVMPPLMFRSNIPGGA